MKANACQPVRGSQRSVMCLFAFEEEKKKHSHKSPLSSPSPSSSTSPSSHAIAVVVVAGSVVISNVVAVVVVGSWLNRVMDLGRLTDASQCRVVAENGLDAAVDLSAS